MPLAALATLAARAGRAGALQAVMGVRCVLHHHAATAVTDAALAASGRVGPGQARRAKRGAVSRPFPCAGVPRVRLGVREEHAAMVQAGH